MMRVQNSSVSPSRPERQVIGSDRDDIEIRRTFEFTDGDKPDERIDTDGSGLMISASCPRQICRRQPHLRRPIRDRRPVRDRRPREFEIRRSDGDRHPCRRRSEFPLRGGRHAGRGPRRLRGGRRVGGTGGTSTVEVPQDPAGIPVRLRSGDGAVSATTDPR